MVCAEVAARLWSCFFLDIKFNSNSKTSHNAVVMGNRIQKHTLGGNRTIILPMDNFQIPIHPPFGVNIRYNYSLRNDPPVGHFVDDFHLIVDDQSQLHHTREASPVMGCDASVILKCRILKFEIYHLLKRTLIHRNGGCGPSRKFAR